MIESPFAQIYSKVIAEHIAGTGGIDVIDGSPVWMPDFAEQKVIDPIDSYISKYKAQSTLNDYHPLYRALMKYKNKTWGFFDDGDVWNLYYRKDIFSNAKLKAAQSEVQARPSCPEDLGRVHRDIAVHHRPDGTEGVRRR